MSAAHVTCYHWTKPRTKRKPQLPSLSRSRRPTPRRSSRPPQPAPRPASRQPHSHRSVPLGKLPRLSHRRSRRRALRQLAKPTAPSSPNRPKTAIRAAEAAAEAAALNAQAVADAQYQLLADLDHGPSRPPAPAATATPAAQPPITELSSPTPTVKQGAASGLTIRLYDARPGAPNYPAHTATSTSRPSQAQVRFDETEALEAP